jgi:hypothetical protein
MQLAFVISAFLSVAVLITALLLPSRPDPEPPR